MTSNITSTSSTTSASIFGVQQDHVVACWNTLEVTLTKSSHTNNTISLDGPATPFFVTLLKNDGTGNYVLRGCIGSLSPRPLYELPEYALKAAFEDSRFSKIEPHELLQLSVGVSFLVAFEPAATALDWVVGIHGIIIEYSNNGKYYKATFLPEVAPENNWTVKQTVRFLLRKAGVGDLAESKWNLLRVTRYQSSKMALTYEEYIKSVTI